jgi:DNA uptake protein ComE-like DNA-binding protein
MIVLVISPMIYRQFGKGGYQNYQEDLTLLDSVSQILQSSSEGVLSDDSLQEVPSISYIYFDPNDVSFSQMIDMGFDTILSRRIISYRNKGGNFRQSRDLLKIYDFSETLYNRVSSYIRIPEAEKTISDLEKIEKMATREDAEAPRELLPPRLDLNQTDTSQLVSIQGVGPVFSKRIIKYRDLLGGYIKTEQLNEVFGLKDETLSNVKQVVYVDSLFKPEKIRINFLEWRELVKHPYISSDLANRILKTRSMEGPYLDTDDFVKRLGISDSLRKKMVPYLEF